MVDVPGAFPPPHDPPLVLLVDDDSDTSEMYALSLAGCGFAVQQAGSAEAAVIAIRQMVPDLVVADIVLPGMDGFALCREIKRHERTSGVPVIAVTGYSPQREEQAKAAGFDMLLMKPCLPDRLLAEVRTRIAETRALCAASRELRAKSAALRQATADLCNTVSETMKRVTSQNRPGDPVRRPTKRKEG